MTAHKRVFIDTAPLIYYLQRNEVFFDKTKNMLSDLVDSGCSLVTSDITTEEYCVWPLKNGRDDLLEAYGNFIKIFGVEVVHTNDAIAKTAARIRAEHPSFKGMDALQLATATVAGCSAFLTNDKRLLAYKGIPIMLVDS